MYTNEEIVACNGRWHKGCLKCGECGVTLNIKNVQSHRNKPYCKSHVPKETATQVASVEMQNAMKAPKAARAAKGVNKAARGTFAPGALNPTSGADIVNRGGVSDNDTQSKHAPQQSFVAPEPSAPITYDTPDEQFSNMSVSDSGAGGYDEGATYDQGGYDEGYAEEGYAEEGYAEEGYAEEGYAEEGYYEEGGYDEGYAEEGYAEEGYAEEGYYEEGGYDEGYAEEGYYEEGYDEGYYEEGYDEGYYEEGY